MKKKLAALAGVLAVFASSLAFVGTPKANAMLYGGDNGGSGYYCVWQYTGSLWVLLCTH